MVPLHKSLSKMFVTGVGHMKDWSRLVPVADGGIGLEWDWSRLVTVADGGNV